MTRREELEAAAIDQCPECYGCGECMDCGGTERVYPDAAPGAVPCGCRSGRCGFCEGKGTIEVEEGTSK